MSIDFKERFRDRIDVIDKNGNFTKESSKPINAGKQVVISNIYGNISTNQVVNQQEQRQSKQDATFSKLNTQQAGAQIINGIPQMNYNKDNPIQQAESIQVQSAQTNWNPPQNIFQGQHYYSVNPYLPSYPNSGGQMSSQYNTPIQLGQQQNSNQFQSYQDFLQRQQNFPPNNALQKSLQVPSNYQQQPLNTQISLQIPSGMNQQNQMQQMQLQQQGLNQFNLQTFQPNMQQISKEFENVLGQMQKVLEQQQKQIYQLQNQQGFSSQRSEVQTQKVQKGQQSIQKIDKNALRKNQSKSQEPQDTVEKQSNSSQKQIQGLKSRNFRQAQKNALNEQQASQQQDHQEIPNKPKSIFQYAKSKYEANQKNNNMDFNEKPKDIKYKEYNLQDYKNLTPANKLGGLGPFNIGTSE